MQETKRFDYDILAHAASSYLPLGWKIFPLRPKDKVPITTNGFHDASSDPAVVDAWWSEHPKAGIGLACAMSGLIVIDTDPRHGGNETLVDLEKRLGKLPVTVRSRTGGGGDHRLFRSTVTSHCRRSIGDGVDVKHNGYIVLPPSFHPSGNRYAWEIPPGEVDFATLPTAWLAEIAPVQKPLGSPNFTRRGTWGESTRYGLAALENCCSRIAAAVEGERNHCLFVAAAQLGQLIAGGELVRADVEQSLLEVGLSSGLNSRETPRTILSGLEKGLKEPRSAPPRHKTVRHVFAPDATDDQPPPPDTPPPDLVDGTPAPESPPDDTPHADPEIQPILDWQDMLEYREELIARTPANLALALRYDNDWRECLGYDRLNQCACWRKDAPNLDGLSAPSGRIRDDHYTYIMHWFARHYATSWSFDAAAKAVDLAAHNNEFHPVQDYLNSLKWDGQLRVAKWTQHYLGAPEEYNDVGSWWLISAVARAMMPGCQVDHSIILEGIQGAKKSSALQVLGGEWYRGELGDLRDKEAAQGLAGAWIVELDELDAMKGINATRIKSFLTRRVDIFRPSYGRNNVVRARTCVFVGTTNELTYLHDTTGGRRFWPITINAIELDALAADRDQLWAEALDLYIRGARWWPIARKEHQILSERADERRVHDPWETTIVDYLSRHLEIYEIGVPELLSDAIKQDIDRQDHRSASRVGTIMHRLGWDKCLKRKGGGIRTRVFQRPSDF